ncbi:MAG: hypothetical protein ACI80S_001981 [Pseudohongiellaceae bacterium]|jgi:hypothetical protein
MASLMLATPEARTTVADGCRTTIVNERLAAAV